MKVFIAGVMQGNLKEDKKIHSQEYRHIIAEKLSQLVKSIEIIDPDKTDPERLMYTNEQASKMFLDYCKIAGKVDLLIAYIPEASMGSAVEMWMAYQKGIPIISISPMNSNWVVKLLSNIIYSDLEEFINKLDRDVLKELKIL